ncbi:MAG: Mth938-like domain-containing protein [Geminicoccaceae bacterium]
MHTETPRLAPDRQVVQGYRGGGFTVSGVRHQGSLLVLPERVLPWPVAALAELTEASLAPLRDLKPDILVLGTGAAFGLIDPELRAAVRAWGPVIEAMATPAACRTYNLLLAEERRVAAALIALPPG